jgi:hypothetical protein
MFEPNPKHIEETVARILKREAGGWPTVEDAQWWAWEHAFSSRRFNGYIFYRAVHDRLEELRQSGILSGKDYHS